MNQFVITLIDFWYTIAIVFILGRFIYYRNKGKKEYLFTFILLAAVVTLICILISRVELTLGFAFGIFAIFGIIRYRTVPISPREMTYILLSAGIAAKNALALNEIEFYKIVITDLSILLLAGVAEYYLFRKISITKEIVYNNLDLIHPDKREQLYLELNERFGITEIEKLQVGKIDTIKNSARLIISFKDAGDFNVDDS